MHKDHPKIILTGGHLSPLLAVYGILKRKAECVIVGRKYTFENDKTVSLEYELFKDMHVPFYSLNTGRLQRKFTVKSLSSLLRTPGAVIESFRIISRENPAVVLTFGGYVGLPITFAAYLKGIPVVLHEQTMSAGLSNKLIGRFAKKICISFPSSEKYFDPEKTILTGNPIRKEIFISRKTHGNQTGEKVLLILGGSSGSHNINEYIELLLMKLLEHFTVIHQTGDAQEFKDYDRLLKIKNGLDAKLKPRYVLKKFILPSEMGTFYDRADVVLSRAGANTVAELIALNKRAVLIPLSYGQKKEQLENAKLYEKTNLGTFLEEKEMNLEKLFLEIVSLANKKKNENIPRRNSQKNAAEKIAEVALSACSNR